MKWIRFRHVGRQLRYDLTGKDSYRGITLSYAWLANQLGHFSLGFIPATAIYLWLKRCQLADNPALVAAMAVSAAWFLFELANLLLPLLSKKKGSVFKPDWPNLVFDTATDVLFFALGSFAAMALHDYQQPFGWVLAALAVILAFSGYSWYLTKIYMQAAGYPFQFRLSQWNNPMNATSVQRVDDFLRDDRVDHLLMFGGKGTGKTSLAVALATESSIRRKACEYLTAMKLFTLFFVKEPAPDPLQEHGYWTWRNCEVRVIDDINPGDPIPDEIISADMFHALLTNEDCAADNIAALKTGKVIWVLGDGHRQHLLEEPWKLMLQKIGIPPERIDSINLSAG